MVYWFTGQPAAGKTVLATKLRDLLQTEKRNWRKDVFHIDGDNLRELTLNKDYSEQGRIQNIKNAQIIANYLHHSKCDVVVSVVAPYRWQREEFKLELGNHIVEFYVHTKQKSRDERASRLKKARASGLRHPRISPGRRGCRGDGTTTCCTTSALSWRAPARVSGGGLCLPAEWEAAITNSSIGRIERARFLAGI